MTEKGSNMHPLVACFPGNEHCAKTLRERLAARALEFELRRFPDRESYLRIDADCRDADVVVVATLDRPDDKFLALHYFAATARELGARRVLLVAPYLSYMRQDKRFAPGEAITSRHFASLVSACFDGLVTVDPHLHRYASLGEVYSIPTRVVHAAPHIANWVRERVTNPLFVGPDSESAQWVAAVAALAAAPHIVLEKVRHGDRDVEVTVPEVERWAECTPVLVDDIISTAGTMIETVGHLRDAGMQAPVCVGVHAVFADRAYETLLAAGPAKIATANTIAHISNEVDVTSAVADAVADLLDGVDTPVALPITQ